MSTDSAAGLIPTYTISEARPEDLSRLSAIELAAARLLEGHAPESVLNETTSLQVLKLAQREGRLWVAFADDMPVGFAHAAAIEPDAVHLEEIDVHPDHGRRGLGTKLVLRVCDWAEDHGYAWVTLTTFRDVPWNMPFYTRFGFRIVPPERCSAALRNVVDAETRRGLDPLRRVVMKRPTSPAPVNATVVPCRDEAECEKLGAFLTDRIYEFNANATGYFDGMLLGGCIRNDAGEAVAGFNGHTWGGCCELSHVWVDEQYRGQGLGSALLRSAEAEAAARGCVQIVLATHSFQAPGFYERLGYERKYAIEGRPKGYADIIYVKALQAD